MSLQGLRKRFQILEQQLKVEAITLHMPDGSTRQIQARRLSGMMREALGNAPLQEDTKLLLASEFASPDGGMCDLIRAIALSPVNTSQDAGRSA